MKDIIPAVNVDTYDNSNSVALSIPLHNVIAKRISKGVLGITARPTIGAGEVSSETRNPRGCFLAVRDKNLSSGQYSDIVYALDDTLYYRSQTLTTTMADVSNSARAYFSNVYNSVSGNDEFVILNPSAYRKSASEFVSGNFGSMYYGSGKSGTMTQVSGLPTYASHGMASLNGRLYILTQDGRIYNSGIDDPTTWGSADYISAERNIDDGMFIARHRDHIVVWGQKSIEFFYDAGNSPNSPLARRTDVFYNIGTVFPHSFRVLGDTIYFIGNDASGQGYGVYKLENFQLSRVSTTLIDSEILSILNSVQFPDHMQLHGIGGIVSPTSESTYITFDLASGTFVYDIKYNLWYKWNTGDSSYLSIYGSSEGTGGQGVVQMAGGIIVGADGTGLIDATSTTAASPSVYTPFWDKGTGERKRINSIQVLHNADTTGVSPTPTVTVDWADSITNGEAAFTGTRTVKTDTMRSMIYRCGTTRQRMFKLTLDQTNGHKQLIKGLEIDYEPLRG